MASHASALFLLAAVIAVSLAADQPRCYKVGERCEGSYGYPMVDYYSCCPGYTCTGKAKDWGKVCVEDYSYKPQTTAPPKDDYKPTTYAPKTTYGYTKAPEKKCYKEGEKCMGASGYPAIPWLGCCDGYVCEGKAYDWGYTCVKPSGHGGGYPSEKKCYKEGEKCMGASGYPAIPWLGCCDGYVCEGKAYDWGYTCVKPSGHGGGYPSEKKCYAKGEKCMGASGYPAIPWLGCCDGYVCEGKAYDWGYTCVEKKYY